MKKNEGMNVKRLKEAKYKRPKAKAKCQGGSSQESVEQRESYIIEEVANIEWIGIVGEIIEQRRDYNSQSTKLRLENKGVSVVPILLDICIGIVLYAIIIE